MTPIDPTALLARLPFDRSNAAAIIPITVAERAALAAAYVERDALRAEVASYTTTVCACGHQRASHTPLDFGDCTECPHGTCGKYPGIKWDLWHRDALREVTALRAAVARMTGPEAVEAVWTDLLALPPQRWNARDLAAVAVRAIAALGAP